MMELNMNERDFFFQWDAFDSFLGYCTPRELLLLRYVNKRYKQRVEKYYLQAILRNQIQRPFVTADIMCQSYNIHMRFKYVHIVNEIMCFEVESPVSLDNLDYDSEVHIYISKLSHCYDEKIHMNYMKKYMNRVRDMDEGDSMLLLSCEESYGEVEIPYKEFPYTSIFYRYKEGPVKNIFLLGIKLHVAELTNMYIPQSPIQYENGGMRILDI